MKKGLLVIALLFTFSGAQAACIDFDDCLAQAKKGGAEAQLSLGKMYENGDGIEANPKKAVKWYRKAAKQGNADAQYMLGSKYGTGEGVGRNATKAFEWILKAAEQGHLAAMYSLSLKYAGGLGVSKNSAESEKWFEKAVKQELATPGPEPDIDFVDETPVDIGNATETDKIIIRLPSTFRVGRVIPVAIVTTVSTATSLQLLSNRHETPIATFNFGAGAVPYVRARFRIGAPGTLYGLVKSPFLEIYSTAEIKPASEFVHGEFNLPKCKPPKELIQAKHDGELITLKIMISHCMNLDNYIHRLRVYGEEKMIIDAVLSPGISRNPSFEFKFKGSKDDKYKLEWEDNSGVIRAQNFNVR